MVDDTGQPVPYVPQPGASLAQVMDVSGPSAETAGIAQVMLRRIPTMALVTAVCGTLATIAICLAFPPKFNVSAVIHVAPVVRPILFSDYDTDISRQYREYMGSQVRAIQSPNVLADALRRPEIRSLDLIRQAADPIMVIRSMLDAEHVKGTENMRLYMVGNAPADMQQIVNSIAQSYLRHRENEEREWDDKILRSLRAEETNLLAQLKAKGVELRQLAVEDGLSAAVQADSALEKTIVELNQIQIEANRDAAVARAKLNKLKNDGASQTRSADFELILRQDGEWLAAKHKLLELQRAAVEDERLGRGPSHPDVQARPARIAQYKEEMNRRETELRDVYAASAESELRQLIADAEITAEVFFEQMQRLAEKRDRVSKKVFFLEDVRHERERIEHSLAQVREKIWNVQVEQHRASRMTLASPASAPQEPNIDKRPKYLAAAWLGCLALATFAALIRDRIDTSMRSPTEVTARLGLPLLGSIQHVPNTNGGISTDVRVVEPVRGICTALLVGSEQDRAHCRMITSPTAGSGKSTLAINLGRSLAATGRSVLLVDADNVGQGMTRGMKLTGLPGLKEFLEGACDASTAVVRSTISNLFFMPAGAKDANFGDLIVNQDAQSKIRSVFSGFEEVIVDSPPVLVSSNTVALATLVDEILLVLRAGRTTSEEAWTARQYLSTVRGKISGVILNAVSARRSPYGYYGYTYGKDRLTNAGAPEI